VNSLHNEENRFQEMVKRTHEEILKFDTEFRLETISDAAYWRIIARRFEYELRRIDLIISKCNPPHFSLQQVIEDELDTATAIDNPQPA